MTTTPGPESPQQPPSGAPYPPAATPPQPYAAAPAQYPPAPAPYQQPYQQPQAPGGYPPGGYSPQYVTMLPAHPSGTTVLVLGIIGLFFAITGPFAWVMGNKARREIAANPTMYRSDGALTVGWVLGIIESIFLILFLGLFALIIVLAIASTGFSS